MTLNCLQNKTAALNLELDKKASEMGIEMERWKIRGGWGNTQTDDKVASGYGYKN